MTPREAAPIAAGLSVILAISLGIIAFAPDHERRPARADEVGAVWTPPLGELRAVTLDRAAGEDVSLVAEGDGWSLSAPWAVAADPVTAGSLLDELQLERGVPVNTPLGELGLAPPEVVVSLETSAGPRRLEIGRIAPVGQRSYVRVDGGAVFAVSHPLAGLRSASASELRDQRLIQVDPGMVDVVTVGGVGADGAPLPSFRIVRGDPLWTVEVAGAPPVPADPVRLEDWFAALYATRAASGAEAPAWTPGLVRRVTVEGRGPTSQIEARWTDSGIVAVRVDGDRVVPVETGRLGFLEVEPAAFTRPGDDHGHPDAP